MRYPTSDAFLLPLLLLPIIILGLFPLLVLPLVGFLGIATVGVLIAFIAVGDELNATSLFSRRIITQDRVTGSERAGYRMDMQSALRPLFLAKIVSAGLIIIGFGGFYLSQLG